MTRVCITISSVCLNGICNDWAEQAYVKQNIQCMSRSAPVKSAIGVDRDPIGHLRLMGVLELRGAEAFEVHAVNVKGVLGPAHRTIDNCAGFLLVWAGHVLQSAAFS